MKWVSLTKLLILLSICFVSSSAFSLPISCASMLGSIRGLPDQIGSMTSKELEVRNSQISSLIRSTSGNSADLAETALGIIRKTYESSKQINSPFRDQVYSKLFSTLNEELITADRVGKIDFEDFHNKVMQEIAAGEQGRSEFGRLLKKHYGSSSLNNIFASLKNRGIKEKLFRSEYEVAYPNYHDIFSYGIFSKDHPEILLRRSRSSDPISKKMVRSLDRSLIIEVHRYSEAPEYRVRVTINTLSPSIKIAPFRNFINQMEGYVIYFHNTLMEKESTALASTLLLAQDNRGHISNNAAIFMKGNIWMDLRTNPKPHYESHKPIEIAVYEKTTPPVDKFAKVVEENFDTRENAPSAWPYAGRTKHYSQVELDAQYDDLGLVGRIAKRVDPDYRERRR